MNFSSIYKLFLSVCIVTLTSFIGNAQTSYKTDFDNIKKVYAALTSYEVPVEFGMSDLKTGKLIQKSSGTLLQTPVNRYYKSSVLESITYNELCVDVYHTDKTIVVSKKLDAVPTDLNPISYLIDNYAKVNTIGDSNGNRTYELIFNSSQCSKIAINFNIKSFYVNYLKIYDKVDATVTEPIVIDIKYGKITPKSTTKDNFPISKYIVKTSAGYKCQPAYVNYELMDTYTN